MFLKEFVPQTLRDVWCAAFEWLRQGTMTVSEYAIRFSELARHAPILVPTIRKRVSRFIEGLDYDIKICVARELQTDASFQQVVEIARKIEGVLGEERGSKEAKRPRRSRGFNGFYSSARTHYSRGSSSRSAQFAHQITRSALVYSAPPTRDSYSGYSSYPAQTQYEQPRPLKGFYECGDTRRIMRDCPRLGRGGFHHNTPATSFIPVDSPHAQSVRGGGQTGSGCLRGGGMTR
ncbi:uncharacterized protein [Nicotiana tomentosiformis]|uniref:uncharacterized protein n=1 Tax=Nicotiana tomentosiformis TaxID=4098 RepID=UPI00388C7074